MRRCPICGKRKKIQSQSAYDGPILSVPAPMYQRSYHGAPKYILPRCLECFQIAIKEET